ncbi:MAG: hypothetical protein OXI88_07290 [Gammaproteobacteria bacterium]|nr:hypothetical protein [Gammaproteobacteria bacterium]MDE0511569.1 hypothetical protein [Gammaproteobacteria bacterium]
MAVRLNRFSDVIARPDARDRDVVTVTKQNELKLGRSRFRLTRWFVNSGIGKRIRNRRTVDAFVASLRRNFGDKVVNKMNLAHLDKLRSRGKPLDVRLVRAYLVNAGEVKEYLDVRSEQKGSGALSAASAGRIQDELTQFTGTESLPDAKYPDFFEGAVKDYGRARYVINDEEMHKDTGKTVQALTGLCRDNKGETDKKLLTVVQGMLYQRVFSFMLKECAGIPDGGAKTGAHPRPDSPFRGCYPVGRNDASETRYSIRPDPGSGKLLLDATHSAPVQVISHAASNQDVPLDLEQSRYSMQLQVEVDPADYSVTLTKADYEFQFTPQSRED